MIGSNRAAYGARSQRGGAEREVVHEQPPKVETLRHLGAAEESDGDMPPAAVEQAQVLCEVVAADHVKDDVHAPTALQLLDPRDVVLLAVVDRGCGAERDARGALVVGASGGVDRAAHGRGELDGGGADAAGAAGHQVVAVHTQLACHHPHHHLARVQPAQQRAEGELVLHVQVVALHRQAGDRARSRMCREQTEDAAQPRRLVRPSSAA